MAKKLDLEALRQQINELQIDKDLKHDLLAAINDKQRYGLVWEESSEEAWDEMQDKLPVFVEDATKRLDSAPEGSPNHVLIEGDNLNALAALTYAYAGKIDVIYIDPPYNTGNKDFIYNDSFVDKEDGFRHSKWLSFMNRRLKIAKKLLSEKGVIFISIDDNEQADLKLLCDKTFGEDKFVATIPWRKRTAKSDVPYFLSQDYEWVQCYANENYTAGILKDSRKYYETPDFPNRPWRVHDMSTQRTALERPNSNFTMVNPRNNQEFPVNPLAVWRITKDGFPQYLKENRIVFPGDYDFLKISKPVLRYWKEDDEKKAGVRFGYTTASTYINEELGMTQDGTKDIINIFGEKAFGFPKPLSLIKYLLKISNPHYKDSTILDFFAGSGTTLHATMQLNSEDGGHRKCILVTNNENNICEKVTYERNKRVIKGYTNQKGEEVPGLTHNNLRYYKTEFVPRDQSNFKSRRALMASLVDLLCIKNNIYQEQETFGGKKFKKNVLRYFKDEAGQMLVVLDERVVSIVIPMIAEVATKQNPLKVYVYSDGAYAYEDEFHKVMPVIELCAMPDAFLQALEGGTDILPKQKYSEAMMKEFQQNEELAMQNEEVVKEALSDDYDYVLKEKEDNVTNDIID